MPLILDSRYVTLKLLGQGGFGAAFLARDRRTPGMRRCVVKQFQPSGNLTPNQLQIAHDLFEREAEALDRLGNRHPQIPDLFASFDLEAPGAQSGSPQRLFYLVQEYIDGHTLEEELDQQGPLSAAAVTEVMVEVLKILEFVHAEGAIHRDIKPSNVMRTQAGLIYLLDFGAVKQVSTAGTATKSTGIYSQGFAPPEQVAGGQVYACTDFYALAVTCIMLLTGKGHEELYDAYDNSWQWRPFAAAVPDGLGRVLDRMLLAAPSQRYQSVQEVLTALQSPSAKAPPAKVKSPAAHPGPSSSPAASTAAASGPSSSPASSPAASGAAAQGPSSPVALPSTQMPPPPKPAPPVPSPPARPSIAPFSTLELLGSSAFTGFEAGLLAIALFSLPVPSPVSGLLWLSLCGGLIFAQSRRIIEKVDLPIAAGLTLAIVAVMVVVLKIVKLPLVGVVVLAGLSGLLAVAAISLFKLIYNLLAKI
jgi:serine/threonine protein kinase